MYKALWGIAVLAALALGTAIVLGVVNNSDVRAASARVSAVQHQESVDKQEIANLQAELHAKSAAFLEGAQPHQ